MMFVPPAGVEFSLQDGMGGGAHVLRVLPTKTMMDVYIRVTGYPVDIWTIHSVNFHRLKLYRISGDNYPVPVNFDNTGTYLLPHTVCQRSSNPFYVESYNINWFTTSWTYSNIILVNSW